MFRSLPQQKIELVLLLLLTGCGTSESHHRKPRSAPRILPSVAAHSLSALARWLAWLLLLLRGSTRAAEPRPPTGTSPETLCFMPIFFLPSDGRLVETALASAFAAGLPETSESGFRTSAPSAFSGVPKSTTLGQCQRAESVDCGRNCLARHPATTPDCAKPNFAKAAAKRSGAVSICAYTRRPTRTSSVRPRCTV